MVLIENDAIDRIMEAQEIVARAEAGEVSWDVVADNLIKGWINDTTEDPYEFVGILYQNFRVLEAVLHHYNGQNLYGEFAVQLHILGNKAQLQRSRIEEQIEINASYVPATGLERYGQFSIEKDLRWALGRLDQFSRWGYGIWPDA